MVYALAYFGERWDDEIFDNVEVVQIPTPTGELCSYCDELIEDGERGLLRSFVRKAEGDRWGALLEPVHAECDLRARHGSVDHLMGRCSCYGGQGHRSDATFREQALEVLLVVNAQRIFAGHSPMW